MKPPTSKTFDFLHSHLFVACTLSPFHLRYKSVPNPFQVRFIGWEKNGSCMGFGRDLLGSCKDDDVFNAKAQRRREFFEHGRHGKNEFFSQPQISQIRGIFSLALVIEIPKIPNICGFIFAR